MSIALASKIKQLRMKLGMSQADLAGNKCSRVYISQVEKGHFSPTPEVLIHIANKLQEPLNLFVDLYFDTHPTMRSLMELAVELAKVNEDELLNRVMAYIDEHIAVTDAPLFSYHKGLIQKIQGASINAVRYLYQAGTSALEFRDLLLYAKVQFELGLINEARHRLKAAEENFRMGRNLYKIHKIRNKSLLNQFYLNLARILLNRRRHEEAIVEYESLLMEAQKDHDSSVEAKCYWGLSLCYLRMKNYDKSIALCHKALRLFIKLSDSKSMSRVYTIRASTYRQLGKFEIALQDLESAVAMANEIGDKEYLLHPYKEYALIHRSRGNYETAKQYIARSFAIIDTFKPGLLTASVIWKVAIQLEMETGNIDKAYEYFTEAEAILLRFGSTYVGYLVEVYKGMLKIAIDYKEDLELASEIISKMNDLSVIDINS